MSERYRRGIDVAEKLAAEKVAHFVDSGVAEVAPEFARMVIEFALGDVYTREILWDPLESTCRHASLSIL